MFVIVGLGNPGAKYEQNRHNIGFLVVDEMTKKLNTQSLNKSNFKAITLKHHEDIFVKPQTFMNNSGESVIAIKDYFKVQPNHIIVVHDDIDLPFGSVKYKIGGGHGGHNGLRSIDSHLNTKEYIRVRIGVGKPALKEQVANYVLDNFTKEEMQKLDELFPKIILAIENLKKIPIELVKSKYTI